MKSLYLFFLLFIAIHAAGQRPCKRFLQMMSYDDVHNGILMYGGATDNDSLLPDLWILKGEQWKKLTDAGPSPRIKAAFAFDSDRKCAVLFGGSGDKPLLDETWEWDGSKWKQLKIAGPSARNHPMAAYDPRSKQILVFGGFSGALMHDTWAYDGKRWQLKDTAGPPGCLPHGIFYDEAAGSVLLITMTQRSSNTDTSRSRNELYQWTGHNWKKLPGAGPATSPGSLQALAPFDNGGIILFDGDDHHNNTGRTWSYSGSRWTGDWLKGPSPRTGHSMAYDAKRKCTILFGGSDRKNIFGDLWSWNGQRWREAEP